MSTEYDVEESSEALPQSLETSSVPLALGSSQLEEYPAYEAKNSWTNSVHEENGKAYLLQCPECGVNAFNPRKLGEHLKFFDTIKGVMSHCRRAHEKYHQIHNHELKSAILAGSQLMDEGQMSSYHSAKEGNDSKYHPLSNGCYIF